MLRPSASRSARATPSSHCLSRAIGRELYPGDVHVLVAPDKFKGTLTAEQDAEAIAAGWRRGDPSAGLETVPLAEGGEGTLDALVAGLGGERYRVRVTGPLGDRTDAEYAVVL